MKTSFSDSIYSQKRNPSSRMLGQRQVTEKKDMCGLHIKRFMMQPFEWVLPSQAVVSILEIVVVYMDQIAPNRSFQWRPVTAMPLMCANAVEFFINHAEVSIAFVQENKIPAILLCLPNCSTHLKTIVSFTDVSSAQKKEAEEQEVSCFSWEEFSQLGNLDCELPPKQRTAICTIMYKSGTTGEPKGEVITNAEFMSEVLSTDHLLFLTDRVYTEEDSYFSFLPLAHIYDQIIESFCIYKGSSIGFRGGDIRF
ncbi:hypothetical protein M0R45_007960 [Rubus argutus]|uniref:AMP-dependent synthetase/ligase domain-containing protein n=1 Tax=Rubus argutus TaxID=59490 RepID=A0AAW1Y2Q3_RUBAR